LLDMTLPEADWRAYLVAVTAMIQESVVQLDR
jgi:hypothetical protein